MKIWQQDERLWWTYVVLLDGPLLLNFTFCSINFQFESLWAFNVFHSNRFHYITLFSLSLSFLHICFISFFCACISFFFPSAIHCACILMQLLLHKSGFWFENGNITLFYFFILDLLHCTEGPGLLMVKLFFCSLFWIWIYNDFLTGKQWYKHNDGKPPSIIMLLTTVFRWICKYILCAFLKVTK